MTDDTDDQFKRLLEAAEQSDDFRQTHMIYTNAEIFALIDHLLPDSLKRQQIMSNMFKIVPADPDDER